MAFKNWIGEHTRLACPKSAARRFYPPTRWLLLGALILLHVCHAADDKSIPGKKNPFAFVFKSNKEKAVIHFRRAGQHLVVPVMVNGKDAGWFLVDTGAYGNVIDEALAKKLGLPETGKWHIAGIGGAKDAKVCRADSISFGELEIQNHSLTQYDIQSISKGLGVELGGILGAVFWSQRPFTIDYQQSTLTFYSETTFKPPAGAREEEIKLSSGRPVVKCKMEGKHEGWVLLDTGAGGFADIDAPYLEKHPELLANKPKSSSVVSGVAGFEKRIETKLSTFEIFGSSLPNLPVSCGESDPNAPGVNSKEEVDKMMIGLVGEGILHRFRLTFDYMNRKLWSEKADLPGTRPAPDRPAELNHLDLAGNTPLMLAIMHADSVGAIALIKAGANPKMRNNFGLSALNHAIHMDLHGVVKLLIENGVDVNEVDPRGIPPLFLAIDENSPDMVSLLLAKGANPSLIGPDGMTAIKLATDRELKDIITLLKKHLKPND